jgi:hypothetical protein
MKRASATLGFLFLAGCQKPLECTSEVTEGGGTYRASVRAEGNEAEAAVRRRALRAGCATLCKAKGEATPACEARCAVDGEAGKIGARIRCGK